MLISCYGEGLTQATLHNMHRSAFKRSFIQIKNRILYFIVF